MADSNDAPATDAPEDPTTDENPADLGEAGKKALDAERKARRDAEARLKELEPLAERLKEIEDANKDELTRATEALSAAEAARDQAVAEGLRFRIAAKHGISDEDAELFLTGKDEDTLLAQAKRLADREADRKKNGNQAPREGTNPTATGGDDVQFARGLLGGP